MTLLSKIAMGIGACCYIFPPLVYPEKVNPFQSLGIGLLAYSGVNSLGTMTVEKMKKTARNTLIVGAGIGIMLQCGVERDFIVKTAVFTGKSIAVGVASLFTVLYVVFACAMLMVAYSFSRGISPQGLCANALEQCRFNQQVREALGDPIEIQDSSLIKEGIAWKIWTRISSPFFRVLEFCGILRPSVVDRRINYGDSFVILGALQKGLVKWRTVSRGVGKWEYTSLTVDVEEEEDGASVKTIQVLIPKGEISNDEPIIKEVA